ncbi:MAG: NDP-sugar synthase [Sporichthyaceae bacterium]|nr:NDP-sugar synthase [Sporichthyaceae bacterium]
MTEAIMVVGGLGTRLRPLTETTPKALIPCAGVPFVTHLLARARAAGVDHLVLATSYQAELFSREFGDGGKLGLELSYVTEESPLGTGGALRNVTDRLRSGPDDPVLVFNGDILSGHDIGAQLATHRATGAEVTLHLTEVADARAYGCVPTDPSGRVTAFLEKLPEPVTNQINAGCYVFGRRVLDEIPAGQVVSVERETFPGLLARGARVQAYLDSAYWLDVGTPAAFVRGSADLVLGRAPSPAVPPVDGEALVLPGAQVAADAKLGGGACLGTRVRVGAGAQVDGSVLLDGAVVEEGAVIRASIVGAGARIGRGSVLDEAVVGTGAVIGAGNELRSGVRVWTGAVLADRAIRFSSDV